MQGIFTSKVRQSLRRVLSILFTISVVGLLLWRASPQKILALFHRIIPTWLLLGGIIYGLINCLRALRVFILCRREVPGVLVFLPVVFAQSFLNNLLPARLGEAAFIYFLHSKYRIKWGKGTALLAVARILDYEVVAFLFLLSGSFYLTRGWGNQGILLWWAGLILLCTSVFILFLPWLGKRMFSLVEVAFSNEPASSSWLRKLNAQLLVGFRYLSGADWRTVISPALFCSLFIWLGTFAWFHVFLTGLGFHTGFLEVVIGATFAVLSKALPWLTVGGLGAHESGWTLGFTLLGWDIQDAIASGFAVNLLVLLTSSIYGLLGLAWLQWSSKGFPDFEGS